MKSWLTIPLVTDLLDHLYADAAVNDPLVHRAAAEAGATDGRSPEYYAARAMAYMPVSREFGNLLYTLARTSRASTVVEFGTSFGVSTIFLASALRDNGAGRVITTEVNADKAERARANLAAAGLAHWVDLRVGDALETLRDDPTEIDMVFLDGAKSMYLDVFKLLEHRLHRGGIVASDNTDHDGLQNFLDYIRTPGNGFTTSALLTHGTHGPRGHEVTIRN